MRLWDRFVAKAKDIDAWRKLHMSMAEFIDAWRIIPRAVVILYGIGMWKIAEWYMSLEPYLIKDCNVELLKEKCIVEAPTTEHMALVTAVLAVAAAVFGLYTNSGKKWNGFTHWNPTNPSTGEKNPEPPPQRRAEDQKQGE